MLVKEFFYKEKIIRNLEEVRMVFVNVYLYFKKKVFWVKEFVKCWESGLGKIIKRYLVNLFLVLEFGYFVSFFLLYKMILIFFFLLK